MVTMRWEPLNYLLQSGLAELGAQSWEECGNDKGTFNYDPDWARYGRMEAMDVLRFVAARDDADELVGYASIIITDNLHDRTISCAIIQDIFILPEKRGARAAEKMLDYIEQQLSGVGVKHISIASRHPHADRWLKQLGYHTHERIWTKPLGKRSVH